MAASLPPLEPLDTYVEAILERAIQEASVMGAL
jgi:hypothetical protein